MLTRRSFRFRLYPTPEQARRFGEYVGVCRFVYNLALEQREREWTSYRDSGVPLTFYQQSKELTQLRAEVDWIAAVPSSCENQALRDLDAAFANFFAGRSRYPKRRKKGQHESFRFPYKDSRRRRLNRNWGAVFVPKIGEVRFRWSRDIPGRVVSLTVSRDALGWHVSFSSEFDCLALETPTAAIGIDRGIAQTLAFSDGSFAALPLERLRCLERRARKQSRALSRATKGSARRRLAREAVSATKARAARIRAHFNHEQTTRLAATYGLVAVEALEVKNMARSAKGTLEQPGRSVRQKSGLNRSIMEQGWSQFATILAYKLAARGGKLVRVNPAYSSQTCSECGSISRLHRKSQAVFECCDCGHRHNADTNAAINILRAGTRPSVSGPVAVCVDPKIPNARAFAKSSLEEDVNIPAIETEFLRLHPTLPMTEEKTN